VFHQPKASEEELLEQRGPLTQDLDFKGQRVALCRNFMVAWAAVDLQPCHTAVKAVRHTSQLIAAPLTGSTFCKLVAKPWMPQALNFISPMDAIAHERTTQPHTLAGTNCGPASPPQPTQKRFG
jgi:hypothetical protein